jgi:hypothetical protein
MQVFVVEECNPTTCYKWESVEPHNYWTSKEDARAFMLAYIEKERIRFEKDIERMKEKGLTVQDFSAWTSWCYNYIDADGVTHNVSLRIMEMFPYVG